MHYFENFKGFSKTEINLFEPLTVLIGPNGSGKSNVIEGIELLSFIAHGRPLHEVTDVGRGGGIEIRGGLQSCPRYGKKSFSLGFRAQVLFDGENKPFNYQVKVRAKPNARMAEEKFIFDDGTMIFETVETSHGATSGDIEVRYNNFSRGGKKPLVSVSANRSVFSQYKDFCLKNTKSDACIQLANGIMEYLRASFVFDPNPKLMRSYERIGNRTLSKNGANLSAVLYALKEGNEEEKDSLSRLLHWIRQLPEEPYQALDFVTTGLHDVIFGMKEGDKGQFVDARLLSDGTLRTLAVLTALETVEPSSRVVIEEFDNGLHPSRVQVLTQAIQDACKRRNLNVLLTTHNPATLNALQTDQLGGVVLCTWDQAQKAFTLIRLFDLPRYDMLMDQGRLGDLVTRRLIEKYLVPNFEESRKEKALAWLDNLQ
jgi:predicted ATPase